MTQTANQIVSTLWLLIGGFAKLRTPSGRTVFEVIEVHEDRLVVAVGISHLSISKAMFEAALDYLRAHGHYQSNPCRVDSNNHPGRAGPLCLATRQLPSGRSGTRNVTYILPILASFGIVEIDEGSRAMVWLTATQARLTADQQAFASHLSSLWDGAVPSFSHRYSITRHRSWSAWLAQGNGDSWWCSGLSQAARHYAWPEKDAPDDFASLSLRLRKALDDDDNMESLDCCEGIFCWGGVARKPTDASLVWVRAQANDGKLCKAIRDGVKLLQASSSLALHDFDGVRLLMNSAMTKIYAAADPGNIIMYDGRVGAALGLLTRTWLNEIHLLQVPDDLAFRWGPNTKTASNKSETRNPSNGLYRFFSLYSGTADQTQRWAELVRQSNRILQQAMRNVASRGVATKLMDWERALFMIGYDVRPTSGKVSQA